MTRRKTFILLALVVLVPAAAVAARSRMAGAAQETCTAPASWFPNTTQPVNFDVDDDNCNFHRWAWQEFLWLMQPSAQQPSQFNFLTFAYPSDLFVASPGAYPGRTTGTLAMRFIPRDVKDEQGFDVDEITQAGSDDVLVDQMGQPVYYAVLIDSTWYNFALRNGYNDTIALAAAPDTQNFPTAGTGAIELKTAWRVAQTADSTFIPDASSRFFTTQGVIPTVTIVGDTAFVADYSRMIPATLALIGMHVVGTVPGHPEFIWASFEHVDNAPTCAQTPAGATNPATGQAWSLYTPNLACNGNSNCNTGHLIAAVNFAPTPVCQLNAWGDTSATSPNATNIQQLNASVLAQLPGSRSILKNYFLVGGQWTFPGGLPATFGAGTNIRGSSLLANTSMESFTQSVTCFTCHNPQQSGSTPFEQKNISVSHVWPLH